MARLRNSVRLELVSGAVEEVKKRFSRSFVSITLLRGLFGLTPDTVLALQDTGSPTAFDISFFEMSACLQFMEEFRRKRGDEKLASLRVTPLFQRRHVPVIVRMFNPFVADEDVMLFLRSKAEDVKGGTWLLDEGGFWTLKRRFAVKLLPDPRTPGGVIHLPGTFYIGPDRGTISYPGQPMFCRRCGGTGHFKASCTGRICRFCHSREHTSAQCSAPKRCTLCGDDGHLYRECPAKSWSRVVSGPDSGPAFSDADAETGPGVPSEAQDGGLRAHGLVGASAPPPEEALDAAGSRDDEPRECPLLVGGAAAGPGAVGEAPDSHVSLDALSVESGAADPVSPAASPAAASVDDSLADQTSLADQIGVASPRDALGSFASLSFVPELPESSPVVPALFDVEAGVEEEMALLGLSVKRVLPSDEDSAGSAGSERKKGRACFGLSGDAACDSGGSSVDGAFSVHCLRLPAGVVAADLAAAEGVTDEQVGEATEWSMEAAEPATGVEGGLSGPWESEPEAAPEDLHLPGWAASPLTGSPLSPEAIVQSPVFGAEPVQPPAGVGGRTSRIPRPARRLGESAGTVGLGEGVSVGLEVGDDGPVRSMKGRVPGSRGPL